MNEYFKTLSPNWNIPNVKAFTILAFSKRNNPVTFAKDSPDSKFCKQQLEEIIKPDYPIVWLKQIHSNRVIELPISDTYEADGTFTTKKRVVCAIISADCLPIVFSSYDGRSVGIVHAGWKGLAKNIISNIVNMFGTKSDKIIVWIGPGISQASYSVEPEIREEFIKLLPIYKNAFSLEDNGKYLMDLYNIARIQLELLGIKSKNIYGAKWDTFSDYRFHSARKIILALVEWQQLFG